MGKRYNLDFGATKPDDMLQDSLIHEVDTDDEYRYNKYGRWELIPQQRLNSKRIPAIFCPVTDQTGLIYGVGTWTAVNAELHSNGCMVYSCRTTTVDLETQACMRVNDFANADLLPKAQTIFKFDNTDTSSAAFIGLHTDTTNAFATSGGGIVNDFAIAGIGYRPSDTNLFVFHNDASGAVNTIDTGIARNTNLHMFEIEYMTSTTCRITLFAIDGTVEYDTTLSSQIPPNSVDLAFDMKIINANTAARYGIRMYDYIRLEKNRPTPDGTLDF